MVLAHFVLEKSVNNQLQAQLLQQQADLCLIAARKLYTRERNQKLMAQSVRRRTLDQADVFVRRAEKLTHRSKLLMAE
jgi:hypothetical protein